MNIVLVSMTTTLHWPIGAESWTDRIATQTSNVEQVYDAPNEKETHHSEEGLQSNIQIQASAVFVYLLSEPDGGEVALNFDNSIV